MKKLLLSLGMLLLVVSPAFAKKNDCTTIQSGELTSNTDDIITTGYDMWGYNYQAHMFNGFYNNYSRPETLSDEGDWLIMKWNDAWLSNQDCDGDNLLDRHYGYDSYIGSGAWETNHQFGEYEGTEITGWDVSGTWMLDFAGGTHNREFRDLIQDEFGNVTGEFWYLDGEVWKDGGTLTGNVTGDQLYLYYERPFPLTYTGEFFGTINETGIVNGTFTDSHGNYLLWTAVGPDAAIFNTCTWDYFVKIVAVPTDADLINGTWYTADGLEIGPNIWGQFAINQEVFNDACGGYDGLLYKGDLPGLGNW